MFKKNSGYATIEGGKYGHEAYLILNKICLYFLYMMFDV